MGAAKKMKKISLYVTEPFHNRLTEISCQTGYPQALIIREFLNRALTKYNEQVRKHPKSLRDAIWNSEVPINRHTQR
jgi:hypothetical protein